MIRNTIVLEIWNLLFTWSGYLWRLDIKLIGGDPLGSSGHLVFIFSQEKWEILMNPERVWVLEFSVSCLRTVVSGLHFCLTQHWIPATAPLLWGWGTWVDGLLVNFFFLQIGGLVWLFFPHGSFCFILGKIDFSCKDLKRLKDAVWFSLRPRFLYSVLNRGHSSA